MAEAPIVRRLIRRLGRRGVLSVIFDLESGQPKSAVAAKYNLSPSYITALVKGMKSYTMYVIPPELLEYEGVTEDTISSFDGTSSRQAMLASHGVPAVSPNGIKEVLPALPEVPYFNVLLNPALRLTSYLEAANE